MSQLSNPPFFSPSPSPSSASSPSLSPHRTNWANDTFISSNEAEEALCNDRSSFVVCSDIMTLIPKLIKRRMIHSDPSAHILGFQELFIYLNNNQSSMRLRQMIQDYFDKSPSLRGNLSQSSLVSCDDTNNCKHVERTVVEPPRSLNEEPTEQSGLVFQDVDENPTNAEHQSSGNFVSQFSHMNTPDGGRHKRRPAALDGHVITTEPSLDPSIDPQSSQPRTKMNHKNEIAFIRVVLEAAVTGLKAAPIPDLVQIPGALLLLIETYEVGYPHILPSVLSDSIT